MSSFISGVLYSAHAFGQLYTLPLPIWLYLYGGGAAVLLSFLAVGYFSNESPEKAGYKPKDISNIWVVKALTSETAKFLLKTFSVAIFFILIAAGFWGSQIPTQNLAPIIFWIFLLLGLTYLSAIFGNFWYFLNPVRILSKDLESFSLKLKYPDKLGYWPALVIYIGLIWLELLSGGVGVTPKTLSQLIIFYTLSSMAGVYLFGLEVYFKYIDFFNVFFGLLSKISIFTYKEGKVLLKTPMQGLLIERTQSLSLLFFILFMLSSTAFDGFKGTSAWIRLYQYYIEQKLLFLGANEYQYVLTILMLLSPLIFFSLYFLAIALMKDLVKTSLTIRQLLLDFAYSLVPIALAYNVAHYYTLMIIQGQSLIFMVSDPFNKGWNLFNTANFTPNIQIVNTNFIWHSEVFVIIIGHIAAVFLAHKIALQTYKNRKNAMISQLPMLVLMIIYTMTGLWILSQPLTVGG